MDQKFMFTNMKPSAEAVLKGSVKYPKIHGSTLFYESMGGIYVVTEVYGLPYEKKKCNYGVYGYHIHNGTSCSGNDTDYFANAGSHLDLEHCPHPDHTGDMPPLFGNYGYAWSAFYTIRFSIKDILGKPVIIHAMPDDLMTQPSGNSGEKIACGIVS